MDISLIYSQNLFNLCTKIKWCLCLLTHSTHLLEPLEIGVFAKLQNITSQK